MKRQQPVVFFLLYFFFTIIIVNKTICNEIQPIIFEPMSDRWAIVIGVSKYKQNELNLQYADSDAKNIKYILINQCRFDEKQIHLLINEDATRENIRKNFENWLYQNTKKNDKIIIFFSGHGTQDIDNNNDEDDGYDEFIVPYDFDNTDISSAIRDDIFAYWINSLKSENIIIIFDSCYSGGAAKAKGFNHVITKGEIKVDSFSKDILGEIPKEGVALLSASDDNQASFEAPEFKMGLFTYYLLNAFQKSSDNDFDNKLTLDEIYNNLREKVTDYSRAHFGRVQNPILINSIKKPFDLAFLPINPEKRENSENEIEKIIYQARNSQDMRRKIDLLEEACKLDPTNRARYDLADTYFYENEFDKALYHYEICLSLKYITKSYVYAKMSDTYNKLGNVQNAIIYAIKALELDKNDIDIINLVGRLYFKNAQYGKAIEFYNNSIVLNNRQNEAFFQLARINICQMKYDEAIKLLNKASENNPDYFENYYLMYLISLYLEKYRSIRDNAVIKVNKTMGHSSYDLYSNFRVLIKNDNFREYIKKRAEEEVNDMSYLAEPYIIMIMIYSKYQKNITKARDYYYKLIALYPFIEQDKEIGTLIKQ